MEVKIFDALPQEARTIRETIFLIEQGFEVEYDGVDDYATHIVIYDNGEAIATCRVFCKGEPTEYSVGRIAVKKERRGEGIGKLVLSEGEKLAKVMGAKSVHLHAQCDKVPFYAKCGYTEYGEIEYEEFCPHKWMKKEI